MPKARHACIVLLPVGPKTELRFLNDTIESVFDYCRPGTKIVLIDNTAEGLRQPDVHGHERIDFIRCENKGGRSSVYGRLYCNLSRGLRFILDNYEFDTVLRLDDDALLIGSGADEQAIQFFRDYSTVGCLGSYRKTCVGIARDFTPASSMLRAEISFTGVLKHPRRAFHLSRLRAMARQNGYEDGEHCLGAAAFYSAACVARLVSLDMLERRELLRSNLSEDHIFGLLVVAAGFHNADFAGEGKPLGLAWQGLPASPEDLLRMGKTIVHSVKDFGGVDQATIRAEFRRLTAPRQKAAGGPR